MAARADYRLAVGGRDRRAVDGAEVIGVGERVEQQPKLLAFDRDPVILPDLIGSRHILLVTRGAQLRCLLRWHEPPPVLEVAFVAGVALHSNTGSHPIKGGLVGVPLMGQVFMALCAGRHCNGPGSLVASPAFPVFEHDRGDMPWVEIQLRVILRSGFRDLSCPDNTFNAPCQSHQEPHHREALSSPAHPVAPPVVVERDPPRSVLGSFFSLGQENPRPPPSTHGVPDSEVGVQEHKYNQCR